MSAKLFVDAYVILRGGRHKAYPEFLAGERAFLNASPISLAGWLYGCEAYLTRLQVQHADTYHGPQATKTRTTHDAWAGEVAEKIPCPSDESE